MTDLFETDWRKVVTTEDERKVFAALDDPRWEWRTLAGLSNETGVESERVRAILNKHKRLVRRALVADTGNELYTLQQRYFKRRAPVQNAWHFLSSSSSSSSST